MANSVKSKFPISRHVMFVEEQEPKSVQVQKLAQHVEEMDKLEELQGHHLAISHK